jgi:hypothetical protein
MMKVAKVVLGRAAARCFAGGVGVGPDGGVDLGMAKLTRVKSKKTKRYRLRINGA